LLSARVQSRRQVGSIIPCKTRRGNCWDNAPMENFFGQLKEEFLRQFKKQSNSVIRRK
jgi:transposase InsO family protein